MNGYTKLFGSILASTIWGEAKETRVLWITMLAMSDRFGSVQSSIPGLATMARLTLEETEAALSKLLSPDPYSRTKDFDGRRIKEIDGGWSILNHAKYRDKMNADDRREYLAEAKRRSRKKQSQQRVNSGQRKSTPSTHTKAKAKAKADTDLMGNGTTTGASPDVVPLPLNGRKEIPEKRDLTGIDWGAVVHRAKKVASHIPPTNVNGRRCWLKYAVLSVVEFSEAWLMDSAAAVLNGQSRTSPQKHFVGVLKNKAAEKGCDGKAFANLMKAIEIPPNIFNDEEIVGVSE